MAKMARKIRKWKNKNKRQKFYYSVEFDNKFRRL